MRARTVELLYYLLWTSDQLMRPTFRNLTDSFETWAYRAGLWRELMELERQYFLERQAAKQKAPLYRLTEQGRLRALGGRDPVRQWNRAWDGKWRMVVFDLPETQSATRTRLRRFLCQRGFGYLQNSVWISPDPLDEVMTAWEGIGRDVESLITLEARPSCGETDGAIVAGAWDFQKINARYEECLRVLEHLPKGRYSQGNNAVKLQQWARQELQAWLAAVSVDPLLPATLLPPDYAGRRVWQRRVTVLGEAAKYIA